MILCNRANFNQLASSITRLEQHIGLRNSIDINTVNGRLNSLEYEGIAGDYLPAFSVVYYDKVVDRLFLADSNDYVHRNNVLGITLASTPLGEKVRVRIVGVCSSPDWNFNVDRYVFLGENGTATQTIPTSGILLRLGVAVKPNEVSLNIHNPLILTVPTSGDEEEENKVRIERFVDLIDTPSDYIDQKGKVVMVNESETGLVFSDVAGGGATEFLKLIDVPHTYKKHEGHYLRARSDGSGLEFIDLYTKFYDKTSLQGMFSGISPSGKFVVDWKDLLGAPSSLPPAPHTHVEYATWKEVYSKYEIDSKLTLKSNWDHNHDARYSLLTHHHDGRYALSGHNHDSRYLQPSGGDARYLSRLKSSAPEVGHAIDLGTKGKPFSKIYADTFVGDVYGNATTSEKWLNARTITFVGGVTGSISLDGSSNVVAEITVSPLGHNHDQTYYTKQIMDGMFSGVVGGKYQVDWNSINGKPNAFPAAPHTHADYALSEHNHDDRYFTRGQATALFQQFSKTVTTVPGSGTVTKEQLSAALSGYFTKGQVIALFKQNDGSTTKVDLTQYFTKGQTVELFASKKEVAKIVSNTLNSSILSGIAPKNHRHVLSDVLSGGVSVVPIINGGTNNTSFEDSKFLIYDETLNAIVSSQYDMKKVYSDFDTRYYIKSIVDIKLSKLAPLIHDHVGLYLTKQEIEDQILAGHNHDKIYYRISDVDRLLGEKANVVHYHREYAYAKDVWEALAHKSGVGHKHGEYVTYEFYSQSQRNISERLSHYYTVEQVNSLFTSHLQYHSNFYQRGELYTKEEVDAKVAGNHNHDNLYTRTTDLMTLLDTKLDKNGNFDDRYYTKALTYSRPEIDAIVMGKHTHPEYVLLTDIDSLIKTKLANGLLDAYYTIPEVDALLLAKSDVGHNHRDEHYTEAEIDGFLDTINARIDTAVFGTIDMTKYVKTSELMLLLDSNYATKKHDHPEFYKTDIVDQKLSTKADKDHTHDSRYYVIGTLYDKVEVDARIAASANGNHTHNQYAEKVWTQSELALRADKLHRHDDDYAPKATTYSMSDVDALINSAVAGNHNHDNLYMRRADVLAKFDAFTLDSLYYRKDLTYTKVEIDAIVTGNHNHDDLYYTQSKLYTAKQIDALLVGKADYAHGHNYVTPSGLESALAGYTKHGHLHGQYATWDAYSNHLEDGHTQLYYKKPEIDYFLNNPTHNHDDRYPLVNEMEQKLADLRASISDDYDGRYVLLSRYLNEISNKSDIGHAHPEFDSVYVKLADLPGELNKAIVGSHNHDTQYVQLTQYTVDMAQKSDKSHIHQAYEDLFATFARKADLDLISGGWLRPEDLSSYYTGKQVDAFLKLYSPLDHKHIGEYIPIGSLDGKFTTIDAKFASLSAIFAPAEHFESHKIDLLNMFYTEAEVRQEIASALFTHEVSGHNGVFARIGEVYKIEDADAAIAFAIAHHSHQNYLVKADLLPYALIVHDHDYVYAKLTDVYLKNDLYTRGEIDSKIGKLTAGGFDEKQYYNKYVCDIRFAPFKHDHPEYVDSSYVSQAISAVFTGDYVERAEFYDRLNKKENIGHTHSEYVTTSRLGTILLSYALSAHKHDEIYYTKDRIDAMFLAVPSISTVVTQQQLIAALAGKADWHDHKEFVLQSYFDMIVGNLPTSAAMVNAFYRKGEVDKLLANKAEANHSHTEFYNKPAVDGFLASKANWPHEHGNQYIKAGSLDGELNKITWLEDRVNSLSTYSFSGNYYTRNDIDAKFYTKTWMDAELVKYAQIPHNHSLNQILGLPLPVAYGGTGRETSEFKAGMLLYFDGFRISSSTTPLSALATNGVDLSNYYTKPELNAQLNTIRADLKATDNYARTHDHDGLFYTTAQVNQKIDELDLKITKYVDDELLIVTTQASDFRQHVLDSLDGKANKIHAHDEYFTDAEVTARLNYYYTKTNIDDFFSGELSGKKLIDWKNIVGRPDKLIPHTHDAATDISGVLPIIHGGTNNKTFHPDYVVVYDEESDALISSIPLSAIALQGHSHPPTDFSGVWPILKGGTNNLHFSDLELLQYSSERDRIESTGFTVRSFAVTGHTHTMGDFSGILPVENGGTGSVPELFAKDGLVYFDGKNLIGTTRLTVWNVETKGHLHSEYAPTSATYSKSDIDGMFEGETFYGKKLIDWNNVINAPEAGNWNHTHDADEIVSGVLDIERGGTNNTEFVNGAFLAYNGFGIVSVDYYPESFSLSGHKHPDLVTKEDFNAYDPIKICEPVYLKIADGVSMMLLNSFFSGKGSDGKYQVDWSNVINSTHTHNQYATFADLKKDYYTKGEVSSFFSGVNQNNNKMNVDWSNIINIPTGGAVLPHTHDATKDLVGLVPVENGGTNNITFNEGKFVVYSGTRNRLESSVYDMNSFASVSHKHPFDDVIGILNVENGGTGNSVAGFLPGNFIVFNDVTGKIESSPYNINSIALSANTFNKDEVVEMFAGLNSFTGKMLVDWSQLKNIPPISPDVHTHKPADIIGIMPINRGGTNNTAFAPDYLIYFDGTSLTTANIPLSSVEVKGHTHADIYTKTALNNLFIGVNSLTGKMDVDWNQLKNVPLSANNSHDLSNDPSLTGILPITKGGTNNSAFNDQKFILFNQATGKLESSSYQALDFSFQDHGHVLTDTNITGVLPVGKGGTGSKQLRYFDQQVIIYDQELDALRSGGKTLVELADRIHYHDLASDSIGGVLPVSRGGTGVSKFPNVNEPLVVVFDPIQNILDPRFKVSSAPISSAIVLRDNNGEISGITQFARNLADSVTISLTGAARGSALFTGSNDVFLDVSLLSGSHLHHWNDIVDFYDGVNSFLSAGGGSVDIAIIRGEIARSIPSGSLGMVPFVRETGTNLFAPDYILKFGTFVNTISEAPSSSLVVYDKDGSRWMNTTTGWNISGSVFDDYGVGRFIYSDLHKELFYVNESGELVFITESRYPITSANEPNTIVLRDLSGNFYANHIFGTSTFADALAKPVKIAIDGFVKGDALFDGSHPTTLNVTINKTLNDIPGILSIEHGGSGTDSFAPQSLIYFNGSTFDSTSYKIADVSLNGHKHPITDITDLPVSITYGGTNNNSFANNEFILFNGSQVKLKSSGFTPDSFALKDHDHSKDHQHDLASATIIGILPISKGGTNNNSFVDNRVIFYDAGLNKLVSSQINVYNVEVKGHHHTSDDLDGLIAISKGGTNNDHFTNGNFVAFNGSSNKLVSSPYKAASFALSGHRHRISELTEGVLPISLGGTNNDSFESHKIIIFNPNTNKIESSKYFCTDFSLKTHDHDARYVKLGTVYLKEEVYTKNEVNSFFSGFSSGANRKFRVDWNNLINIPNLGLSGQHYDLAGDEIVGILPHSKGGLGTNLHAKNKFLIFNGVNVVSSPAEFGTFALSSHSHRITDILGIVPINKGGTNTAFFSKDHSFIWWNEHLDKLESSGFTYNTWAPSAHRHPMSDFYGILPISDGGTNNDEFIFNKFIAFDGTSLVSTVYDYKSFAKREHIHNEYFSRVSSSSPSTSGIDIGDEYHKLHAVYAEYFHGIADYSNAAIIAKRLENTITISISGDEVGSCVFDGSNDVVIRVTKNHNHDDRYYTKEQLNSGQLDSRYYTKPESDFRFLRRDVSSVPEGYKDVSLGSVVHRFDKIFADTFDGTATYALSSEFTKRLLNPRHFFFTGAVTGSCVFDGSNDVFVNLVKNHEHDERYFTKALSDDRYLRRDVSSYPINDATISLGTSRNRFDEIYAVKFHGRADSAVHASYSDRLFTPRKISITGIGLGYGWFDGSKECIINLKNNHDHNDLYYTKAELDNGVLDPRYYTKIQLDSGALDPRYYTKNESDFRYLRRDISSAPEGNGDVSLGTIDHQFNEIFAKRIHGVVDYAIMANYADRLYKARKISVDGIGIGHAWFDGSKDIVITLANNHNHDDLYYAKTAFVDTDSIKFVKNENSISANANIDNYTIIVDPFTKQLRVDSSKLTRFGFLGLRGQVPFIAKDNTEELKLDTIVEVGPFVETDLEFYNAKTLHVDLEEVFVSWNRFSHLDGSENQPANPQDVDTWTYNPTPNIIISTKNTTSYCGFVSKKKYTSYYHSFHMYVSNPGTGGIFNGMNDGDAISTVLAWYIDESTGREYTLDLVRSPGQATAVNGTILKWAIVYNYRRSDEKIIYNGNSLVTSPANTTWGDSSTPSNTNRYGVKIKVQREDDKFYCYTSEFGDSSLTFKNTSLITLDLNSDKLLLKFRTACGYGYAAYSQDGATFDTVQFSDNPYVYDVRTNTVWYYNRTTDQWEIDTSKSVTGMLGISRLFYNEKTKKMYYGKTDNEIIKVSAYADEVNATEKSRLFINGGMNGQNVQSTASMEIFNSNTEVFNMSSSTTGFTGFKTPGINGSLKGLVIDGATKATRKISPYAAPTMSSSSLMVVLTSQTSATDKLTSMYKRLDQTYSYIQDATTIAQYANSTETYSAIANIATGSLPTTPLARNAICNNKAGYSFNRNSNVGARQMYKFKYTINTMTTISPVSTLAFSGDGYVSGLNKDENDGYWISAATKSVRYNYLLDTPIVRPLLTIGSNSYNGVGSTNLHTARAGYIICPLDGTLATSGKTSYRVAWTSEVATIISNSTNSHIYGSGFEL